MRHTFIVLAFTCAACEQPQPAAPPAPETREEPTAPAEPMPIAKEEPGPSWSSVASGEGTALRLSGADGMLRMTIACMGSPPVLRVSVPGFSPIGSEDRFALGIGDEPVTLVADPTRQPEPGVTAEGPPPPRLADWLAAADQVTALYGTQQVGPVAPPPPELGRSLAAACLEESG